MSASGLLALINAKDSLKFQRLRRPGRGPMKMQSIQSGQAKMSFVGKVEQLSPFHRGKILDGLQDQHHLIACQGLHQARMKA